MFLGEVMQSERKSRHQISGDSLNALVPADMGCGKDRFAAAFEDEICMRHFEDNGFDVVAEVRFACGCSEFSQIGMDFAEGGDDLRVRSAKCVGVYGSRGDERGSHVPVA